LTKFHRSSGLRPFKGDDKKYTKKVTVLSRIISLSPAQIVGELDGGVLRQNIVHVSLIQGVVVTLPEYSSRPPVTHKQTTTK
jgi:hypothetical protein